MYAAVSQFRGSQFEGAAAPLPETADPLQSLERAEGAVRIGIMNRGGQSHLAESFQRGSLKVRFPRQFDTDVPEGVLINTAGGITGGDRFRIEASLSEGAALTLTSQAAEKVYRSAGGEGRIDVSLTLDAGAHLVWLPQETILFNAGRLERRLEVSLAEDAELVLCESAVLGRTAHGETVRDGWLSDNWRVRRGGKLVYADNLNLTWNETAATGGQATLGGNRAFASLLIVSPSAEGLVEPARAALSQCRVADAVTAGASAWDGLLSARIVAPDGGALRKSIITLCQATGVRMPGAWSI